MILQYASGEDRCGKVCFPGAVKSHLRESRIEIILVEYLHTPLCDFVPPCWSSLVFAPPPPYSES